MIPSHRPLVLLAALALVALVATPALAGPPTEQLRAQVERVLKVLEDPALAGEAKAADRRAAVRQIANEIFDFAETARRSLGRHWQARSPAEREEFIGLFTDLLERSYLSRIELYSGERVAYTGETVEGDQARVQSRIVTRQGSEIPLEYRMHRKGDRWLVYDVVIEGVSLVSNYRTQFNKIIQTSSYQELVKKMKSKQDELARGQS
ncbi:MAG TPA: ABC transporter substrate-binding protein [Candidatus Tectomicrobia bacterium]|nr:ABC transporter substrate-binding protein [Candidatus Tectomicrobia bacterium]